jgi:hypothetical protein
MWTTALPSVAYTELVLCDREDVKCGAAPFMVHPEGVEITITVVVSPSLASAEPESWLGSFGSREPGIEIGFRSAEWEHWHWQAAESPNVGAPFTVAYWGGNGTPTGARHQFMVMPLPLDRELALACRWTAKAIQGPWCQVDRTALREALARKDASGGN